MFRALLLLLAVTVGTALAGLPPTAGLDEGKIFVTRVGLGSGLRVVVGEGTEEEIATRPAMAGEWSTSGQSAVFAPKYPLKPGLKYRVLGAGKLLEVQVPPTFPDKATAVTHIYPTATELPENVLRFYIAFNRPMPRGDVYQHVSLYTESGKKDVQPFVELDAELWNADQTLLTLLIDPGRIKKEVKPRIDLGPVFRQGTRYTMVVSGTWPTLDGTPLGKDIRKPISVVAPVAEGIDPKAWKVSAPADEASPLTVAFDRTMDHPILLRALTVLRPDGKPVAGKAETTNDDRGWSFRPTARWAPGTYNLRVDTILEDVSGNRLGRPFEIDLARPAPKEVKEMVDLPFTVGR